MPATLACAQLRSPTFFSEHARLERRVVELEGRLADWGRAKEELVQDSEGRNELLRLAATRWNAVLATFKGRDEAPEALQETIRKLGR